MSAGRKCIQIQAVQIQAKSSLPYKKFMGFYRERTKCQYLRGRPVWQLRGACLRDLRLPRPRVASAFVQTTTCIDGADGDANASLLIPTTSAWLVDAALAGWRWPSGCWLAGYIVF